MGNLTEFRLHRAAALSDSGILSSPSIKTSPLVTFYPRNVIFSQENIIQILSKVSPLVDNLFLLSIKTSLPPRQRETHQQESSFRIPIRSRPWFVDPNTWKGYNNDPCQFRKRICPDRNTRSFSSTSSAVIIQFAENICTGEGGSRAGSPLSRAPPRPLKGFRAPPL